MKDLYNILGVSKDADEKEIKKAYRKLSLKYHPDKQNGKSEEEQKEAEQKMQELNEAYSVLSDKEKRSNYDRFGDHNGGRSANNWNPWADAQQPQYVYQGDDAFADAAITLEDIYNGNDVHVKYGKYVKCDTCQGKGYDKVEVCPFCNGSGVETIRRQVGNHFFMQQTTCRHCHGTGKKYSGNKCSDCNGSGLKYKESEVKIKPKPEWFMHGVDDEPRIRLRGAGHEHKEENSVPGGLIIGLNRGWDPNRYSIIDTIDGPTVVEMVDIDVFDALTGCKHELELPDKSKIRITIPKLTYDGKILNLKGKGLKTPYNDSRNTYKIKVHVTMPDDLNDKQIKLLNKIKNL